MEVFNKIRNTVSNLGAVLPGNPVTREFEVERHIASAGPGLLWKIFQGYKRSTKQEAAVFVLEKKQLERYSKRDRDVILDILKKGVAQLTRLRHPSILTVQHPLEESRESLAFATEPVFASLANLLGNNENMPVPPPPDLKDFKLFEVEIKYGLLQIGEGLVFLHNDVKMMHRNICPTSVIINKSGAWKIAGFDFSVSCSNPNDPQPEFPFYELEADLPPAAQPNLDYVAPEYVLTLKCDTASDMFSLGMMVYAVFNNGSPIYNNCGNLSTLKKHAKKLQQLSASVFSCFPSEAKEHFKMLLNATAEVRPDAHQFSKFQFFEDVGVKTLQYLDSLYQWDNLQKSHFFKGLPQVLAQMPKRVALQRVLPCLVKEYVNPEMVPFVLPNVLLIAEQVSKEEFRHNILPDLIPVFKLQEPVQILLIFMQKMELLLTKCPPEDIRNHVLPMVYRSLESDAQQIQELCLNVIPNFAGLIEYSAMKNALIPHIKKLCLTTSYLSVRVNCLVCLGKLLEHLDKWLVLDDILPVLPQIPSKEPAVLMGILGIYKLAMTHKKLGITKDVMATKVIPFLMPLTIENGLTLNQFNAIISVVKDMINKVETEHRGKLEQLNSIRQEQSSTLEMTQVHPIKQGEIFSDLDSNKSKDANSLGDMFQGLGLDSYVNKSPASKASVTSQFSSVSTTASNTSQLRKVELSLEEKQQLAQQQEQQLRFKMQAPIIPENKPLSTSNPAKPRNLTNSLLDTNLTSLGLSPGSTGPLQLSSSQNSLSPLAQSSTGLMSNAINQTSFRGHTNTNTLNSWPAFSQPLLGAQATTFQPQSSNLSSLDNLLIPGISSSRLKPPLNQISSGPQSLPVSVFPSFQPQRMAVNQPLISQSHPYSFQSTVSSQPHQGTGSQSIMGTNMQQKQMSSISQSCAKDELDDFFS
ncbi:SCY1-like protein 2 isoform X1 [Limulus polyphemus]|uniref:SCY1-like protein 2 isoform X1 n=1 Tax=Limulus polyphemus TaxID=6850 RepID=A0ABM1TG93_LIMPO|nr:SCY1-like protein 2 isoform X1 [Limulus polyphemus]XP_022254899.1 SCY1-like protein 2 isoform X1 [Limulus polyphemus]